MRHAAALRAGLAGHTVGGGGIERPFLRQGEVPPLPGRVPPGRGSIADAGNGSRRGAKPTMKAYAAAREKSISAGTAEGCLPKRGTRRAATDCSGRLKAFLK
ncbi:hypothetical protein NIB75_18750 [Bacteroides uniformis]|nr:hypothetical protein [Bacteroides uniformis]